jgi:hypothetical protein
MHTKKDLWDRLRRYHFDHLVPPSLLAYVAATFGGPDASTKAFADKLTRKLHWSKSFAMRAIAEYKKFVYLGVSSEFSVTPSKVIDQVWHEHLLFTVPYASFCRDVLEKDFNHHPELVPTDGQTGVFQAQYLATLDRYRREFNAEPPGDIWSVPKFKGQAVQTDAFVPRKKAAQSSDTADGGDLPLWTFFDGDASGGHGSHSGGHDGFGFEGGLSGGAGSTGDFSDSGGNASGGGDAGAGGDSGGGSCGSGCSGGCGGGCGS